MIQEVTAIQEAAEIQEAAVAQAPAGRNRVLRNVTVLAGSQVVTWGLSLLWILVVPRHIGAGGLGILTAASAAVAIFASFMASGPRILMVKEIARDRAQAPRILGSFLIIDLAIYPATLVLMALYVRFGHFDTQHTIILWLAAVALLPSLLKGLLQGAFQAVERMEYIAASDIFSNLGYTGLGIVIVSLGFNVLQLAWLGVGLEFVGLVMNAIWIRSLIRVRWRPDLKLIRRLLANSLPYCANYVVHVTYTWIDTVILATMTTTVVVGWYGASSRLLSSLFFIPVILSTALLPRLAAAYDGNLKKLQDLTRPALELVMVASLPVAVGAALVSGHLIAVLYGPDFARAEVVLSLLLFSLPFTYFNILVWQVLVASNRQLTWTKVMVGATVVNVVANIGLVAFFQSRFGNGAEGAAVAMILTEALMTGAGLVLLPRMLNLGSVKRLLRAVAATAAMAMLVWSVRGLGLAAELLVGCATFGTTGLLLRLMSREELRDLRAAVGRRLRPKLAA